MWWEILNEFYIEVIGYYLMNVYWCLLCVCYCVRYLGEGKGNLKVDKV